VWSAACEDRSAAMREEARIKRLSRAEKLVLIG
jgi:predicted GIY-YIG superfamily endonuclease